MRSLLPISLVLLSASGLADTPAVGTDTGLVQGVLDDNVIVYKGIPFAAPPVAAICAGKHRNSATNIGAAFARPTSFPSQCSPTGAPSAHHARGADQRRLPLSQSLDTRYTHEIEITRDGVLLRRRLSPTAPPPRPCMPAVVCLKRPALFWCQCHLSGLPAWLSGPSRAQRGVSPPRLGKLRSARRHRRLRSGSSAMCPPLVATPTRSYNLRPIGREVSSSAKLMVSPPASRPVSARRSVKAAPTWVRSTPTKAWQCLPTPKRPEWRLPLSFGAKSIAELRKVPAEKHLPPRRSKDYPAFTGRGSDPADC